MNVHAPEVWQRQLSYLTKAVKSHPTPTPCLACKNGADACPRTEPLNVVGIDDWAFRRNRSYGTIVCDLDRRRNVTLLPDREMATVEAWLAGHPDITDIAGACKDATAAEHQSVAASMLARI